MNRKLMEKWIAALRSGKYEQGREALCQTNGRQDARFVDGMLVLDETIYKTYCCLGVLQDIEPRLNCNLEGDEVLDEEDLQKFLGVSHQDGFHQSEYAGWNDAGTPFPVIADRLEQRWLKQEDKT